MKGEQVSCVPPPCTLEGSCRAPGAPSCRETSEQEQQRGRAGAGSPQPRRIPAGAARAAPAPPQSPVRGAGMTHPGARTGARQRRQHGELQHAPGMCSGTGQGPCQRREHGAAHPALPTRKNSSLQFHALPASHRCSPRARGPTPAPPGHEGPGAPGAAALGGGSSPWEGPAQAPGETGAMGTHRAEASSRLPPSLWPVWTRLPRVSWGAPAPTPDPRCREEPAAPGTRCPTQCGEGRAAPPAPCGTRPEQGPRCPQAPRARGRQQEAREL